MARPKTTEETKNPARGRTMADATEAALRGEISREQWAEAGFPAKKYPTGGKAEAAPREAGTRRTSKAKGRASEVDAEEAETKGAKRASRKKGETSLPAEQDGGEDTSESGEDDEQ